MTAAVVLPRHVDRIPSVDPGGPDRERVHDAIGEGRVVVGLRWNRDVLRAGDGQRPLPGHSAIE